MSAASSSILREFQLMKLSYQEGWLLKEGLEILGYELVKEIGIGNAFCFVALRNGEYYIVFRGTGAAELPKEEVQDFPWWKRVFVKAKNKIDPMYDFLENANSTPIVYGGLLYAHSGFVEHVKKLELRLWNVIKDVKEDIHFRGHSLGGAAAVYETYFLCRMGKSIASLITCGCPTLLTAGAAREWKRVVVKEFGVKHTRYINGNDPVPDLPGYDLKEALLEWKMPNTRYVYPGKGTILKSRSLAPIHTTVKDHYMVSYIESIQPEGRP